MERENDNMITVIDENDNEIEMEILFTFDSDEFNKSYVLYFNPLEEEPEVYASSFDDEGNLSAVETDEEWAMIEEVYNTFMSDEENLED